MRTVLIITSFLVCHSNLAAGNEIDKLTTTQEFEEFLAVRLEIPVVPRSGERTFFKVDIDNNGTTDLLVKEVRSFVVLDIGGDKYEVRELSNDCIGYEIVDLVARRDTPLLFVKETYGSTRHMEDTLVFMFGDFIEYNAEPHSRHIRELQFDVHSGMVTGFLQLKISADAQMTVNRSGDTLTRTLSKDKLDQLASTLSYIDLTRLKNYYYVEDVTDLSSVILKVVFDDGGVKRIEDYGGCGTLGLKNLYRQLSNLVN